MPAGSIIGNANSKIYHMPGCSTYARVSAKHRVHFKTEEEAVEAGYRISSDCETSIPVKSGPQTEYVKKVYQRGSRGGCIYINGSGKKSYVDESLCN